MEQIDVQKHAVQVLRWVKHIEGWPRACNVASRVLAIALWEFGARNLELISCPNPDPTYDDYQECCDSE